MTCSSFLYSSGGATFSEVLVAMALTMIGLIGAMGAFETAGQTIGRGMFATRALALAQSRLEAKRSVRWEQLLMDDLDHDGVPEILMHDDGTGGDRIAGDGIYSAEWEQNGLRLNWTVAPSRPGDLPESGFALLEARAWYESSGSSHEVRLVTLRANPAFTGSR